MKLGLLETMAQSHPLVISRSQGWPVPVTTPALSPVSGSGPTGCWSCFKQSQGTIVIHGTNAGNPCSPEDGAQVVPRVAVPRLYQGNRLEKVSRIWRWQSWDRLEDYVVEGGEQCGVWAMGLGWLD